MSDIDFGAEYAAAQKFINKNIAVFNVDHPDPKAENYSIEFTKLIINHVAYAIAMGEVNKKLLNKWVEFNGNRGKPVQSEKDPEISHQTIQDSASSPRPNEVECPVVKTLPKQTRRKK